MYSRSDLPEALYETIKQIINKIPNCSDLKVIKTSLIDNEKWKALIK
jgi:hypothetical protein